MAEMQKSSLSFQDTVDTPALLLNLSRVKHNINALHGAVARAGAKVRSHGKAHKCPELAQLQIGAGAIGICCQKVSEAEVFFAAGIQNIVVTNQVVGSQKISRLVEIAAAAYARGGEIGVCVDHPLQVEQLGQAMQGQAFKFSVWLEFDVGQGRCGVLTEQELMALAVMVGQHPTMRLAGIQAYHGRSQHIRNAAERNNVVNEMLDKVRSAIALFTSHASSLGITLPIQVSGGGTGSYQLEAASGLYTEIQAGSYVLMDADYQRNTLADDEATLENALTVLCTVISERPGQIVVDGGLKAFAVDSGLPIALNSDLLVKGISDEHTVIEVRNRALQPLIGRKIELIPGHCDPTVNLHREFVVHEHGDVVARWPIAAQGALF
jgi:D-serine deaminase-like pyridoxal phosphate-dependent protein